MRAGQSAGRTLGTHLSQGAEQGGWDALPASGAGSRGRDLGQTCSRWESQPGWTGRPAFAVLRLMARHGQCTSYSLKVSGNPVSSKSFSAVFPTAFAHFVSLCPILVILTVV